MNRISKKQFSNQHKSSTKSESSIPVDRFVLQKKGKKQPCTKEYGERGTLRIGGFKPDFNATKINLMVRNSLKIKQLLTSMLISVLQPHTSFGCLVFAPIVHQRCTNRI